MKNNSKNISNRIMLIKRLDDTINSGIEYLHKHKGELPKYDVLVRQEIKRFTRKRNKIYETILSQEWLR